MESGQTSSRQNRQCTPMNISAPILISSTNPATPTDLRPTFARRILPAVSNPSSPSAPWACARNSMSGRVSDDPAHLCDLRTESEGTVVGGEDVESESGLRSVTKGSEKDVSSDIGLVEENLPEGESMVVNRPRRRRPKCLWLLASLVIVICVIVVMIPLTIKVIIPSVIQNAFRSMDFTTSPRSDAQSQMSLGNLTLTKFTSTGLFFDLSATIPVPHSSLPFGTFVIEPPFNVGVLYLGRSSGPWLLGNIDMGDNPIELRAGDPPCEVDLKHAFLKIVEPDWVRDSFIPRLINQDYEIVMDFALRVSGANFKVLGIPVQGVDLYREVKVNLSQWLSQAAIGSTTFDTVDINIGTDHTGIHVSVFAELGESLIPVSASVPSLSFDVCAITSVQSSPILATPRDSWCLGNINATVGIQSGLKINALVHGRLVAGNNPIRIFSSGTTATADFDLSSFRFNDQDGMTISFLEQMFSNSYTLFRSVQVPVTVDVTNFIRDAIMQVSSGLAVGGFSVSVNVTDEGVLATVVGTNIPSEFRVGPTSVKVSGSLLNGGGITIRIGETALGVVEWSGLNLQSGNMNATLLIHLVNGDEVETSVAFMIDSAMELARLMMSGAGQVPVSFPAAGVGDIGINIRDTTGQTGTLVLPVSATVSLARLFQQVLQSRNLKTFRNAAVSSPDLVPWRKMFVPRFFSSFSSSIALTDAGFTGEAKLALSEDMPPLELNIPRLSVDILLGSAADQIKLATFNFYVIQLSSQIPPVPISLVSLVDPTIVPRLISLFQTVSGTAEIEFANLRFGASQNETTITTFSRSRIYFSVPLKATPSAIQLTQFVFSIVPLRVQAEIISALPVNITLAPWITADVSNAVGAKLARVNITGQRKGSVTVNEGNQGFEMEAKDVNIGALLQFGVDKADHTVQIGNVVVEGVRWLTEGLVGLSLRIPTDNFFG